MTVRSVVKGGVTLAMLVVALAAGSFSRVHAQSAAQASAVAGPALTAPGLDPLPHQQQPDATPYPDYFSEALKLTGLTQPGVHRALRLTPGLAPEVLVLPVQMQAFGFGPAFTALAGALLDRKLAARGISANRQTDLFDANGPFARRFGAEEVATFAALYPNARTLALYIGRDGAGKNLLTLTLQGPAEVRKAHRSVAESADAEEAQRGFDPLVTEMLKELGLAGNAPTPEPTGTGCQPQDWALEQVTAKSSRRERACRSLVLGALFPTFDWPTGDFPRLQTANKLAWLAAAHVESDALPPALAAAVRAIVWSELELAPLRPLQAIAGLSDVEDPVIRPLARMLWADDRAMGAPFRAPRTEADAYAERAAAGLPPFARAVVVTRARLRWMRYSVDLCALEQHAQVFRRNAECTDRPAPVGQVPAAGAAVRNEFALLEAWRLARWHIDLIQSGVLRADPAARSAVLRAMPADVVAHPFIRMTRFGTEGFAGATGTFEALMQRARAGAADFLQATVDIQRWSSVQNQQSLEGGRWIGNARILAEPGIALLVRAESRLSGLLGWDGFVRASDPLARYAAAPAARFLHAGGPPAAPPTQPSTQPLTQPSLTARVAAAPVQIAQLFDQAIPSGIAMDTGPFKQALAIQRDLMEIRALVALATMKAGQSASQARTTIDERPPDKRAGQALSESHAWAQVAHPFFFAGEFSVAKSYYEVVLPLATGSEPEHIARIRLALMAADVRAALAAARRRLARYENDFGRRDLAGLEFIVGQPEAAWAALRPRLALSARIELWTAAQAGHRLEDRTGRQVRDWIRAGGYGQASLHGAGIGDIHVGRYLVDDRLPGDDDLALTAEMSRAAPGAPTVMEAMARLQRLAFDDRPDGAALQAVRELIDKVPRDVPRGTLKPLYAWVAWHVGKGEDAEFAVLREADLNGDFDSMLARAILSGLEGRTEDALTHLRGARIELALLGMAGLHSDLRSAPYMVALANYLLHRKTRHAAYRDEALRVAAAYQTSFPYLAWPHALQALLSPEGPARAIAACRARHLDRHSQFLKLSGLVQPAGPACRKPLW